MQSKEVVSGDKIYHHNLTRFINNPEKCPLKIIEYTISQLWCSTVTGEIVGMVLVGDNSKFELKLPQEHRGYSIDDSKDCNFYDYIKEEYYYTTREECEKELKKLLNAHISKKHKEYDALLDTIYELDTGYNQFFHEDSEALKERDIKNNKPKRI